MKMKPIYPKPMLIKTIWAGNRMAKWRSIDKQVGTIREVCTYKDLSNVIEKGFQEGRLLKNVIDEYHDEIMGRDEEKQLLRVAYMDTSEDLSIQVHPNREIATKINDFEKTEAWYILDCDEDAYVIAGTTINDKDELESCISKNTLSEHLIKHSVRKGDFIEIPAGMIHACGKNILALEISGFGGITYRVYDYGRSRQLHIKQAMEAINCNVVSQVQNYPYKLGINKEYCLTKNSVFCINLIDVNDTWFINTNQLYVILICVQGTFQIIIEDEIYSLCNTETMIVPAQCSKVHIVGTGRLLSVRRP